MRSLPQSSKLPLSGMDNLNLSKIASTSFTVESYWATLCHGSRLILVNEKKSSRHSAAPLLYTQLVFWGCFWMSINRPYPRSATEKAQLA
jgi:hypothetical protein